LFEHASGYCCVMTLAAHVPHRVFAGIMADIGRIAELSRLACCYG
jgi:hypothetical protein